MHWRIFRWTLDRVHCQRYAFEKVECIGGYIKVVIFWDERFDASIFCHRWHHRDCAAVDCFLMDCAVVNYKGCSLRGGGLYRWNGSSTNGWAETWIKCHTWNWPLTKICSVSIAAEQFLLRQLETMTTTTKKRCPEPVPPLPLKTSSNIDHTASPAPISSVAACTLI